MTDVDFNAGLRNPGHAQTAKIPSNTGHSVRPRFYEETVKTDRIDGDTGLPVFRTVEYVEILIAGDKNNAPTKRVTPAVIEQFPDQYALWKAKRVNADMVGDGVPLSLWPTCSPQIAKALEFMNVFTVQQLAGLADTALSKPGQIGLRELREKARTFMETAKTAAPIVKLEAENKELKDRMALMQDQMGKLLEKANEQEQRLNEAGISTTQQQPAQRRAKKEEN